MRLILAAVLGWSMTGCFAGDSAAGGPDGGSFDAVTAGDGGAAACNPACAEGEVCTQYRRHELRCVPHENVPGWTKGKCGKMGQRCCPLRTPDVGIATDVCRPGLVCQVKGLAPAWEAKCLP